MNLTKDDAAWKKYPHGQGADMRNVGWRETFALIAAMGLMVAVVALIEAVR